jgi:hypothetical protein
MTDDRPIPPEEIPRYQEEGEKDPFGLDQHLLASARDAAFQAALDLTALAHAGGVCVTLPDSRPGTLDPALKSWRAFVQLDQAQHAPPQATSEPPAMDWVLPDPLALQRCLQRLLVALAATGGGLREAGAERAAELIEDLGYLSLAGSFRDRKVEIFGRGRGPSFFFDVGKIVARLHGDGAVHGDIHQGNFLYDAARDEVLMSDVGTVRFKERRLTLEERVADVAALKLTAVHVDWEAFKLGYLEVAPVEGRDVFRNVH